jgi:hypothetical protein
VSGEPTPADTDTVSVEATEEPRVVDVVDLLQLVELTEVHFYEISGRRRVQDTSDGDSSDEVDAEAVIPAAPGHPSISVMMRSSPTFIEVRTRLALLHEGVEFAVDAAALYRTQVPVAYTEDLRTEFAERVGVMALWPFLREALHTHAAKLRTTLPLLGLLRAGQVDLEQLSVEELEQEE